MWTEYVVCAKVLYDSYNAVAIHCVVICRISGRGAHRFNALGLKLTGADISQG